MINEQLEGSLVRRLKDLRAEDPRLDVVLELGRLEEALRDPGAVDLYGVAMVYKARLLRRRDFSDPAGMQLIDDILTVVDDVIRFSGAG